MISASGGDGACVPGCSVCKEKRRCIKCKNGYTWKKYQCSTNPSAAETLVSTTESALKNDNNLII